VIVPVWIALLWGAVATAVLMSLEGAARGVGWTRLQLAYLVGTIFTERRQPAGVVGTLIHFLLGLGFGLLYVLVFTALGAATWWTGALLGLVHGAFSTFVVLSALPSFHPRMATEQHGPTATRYLEPPGFGGHSFGRWTPLVSIAMHVAYGATIGLLTAAAIDA
jgi:hypothetical protein